MFHNKLIVFALLLTAGCTMICAAQMDVSLNNAEVPAANAAALPAVDDVAKKTTTTTTTTTTTPPPDTSSSSTSTSTTSSTSTSTSSTSTTTTTTTTEAPPTTSSTTAAPPTPTTTVAPITTPAPAPAPYVPGIGQWNSSCILVKMAAQLNITYETNDNKTTTTLYNIPVDAVVDDAHCVNNVTQTIQINWGPKEAQSSMLLQFDNANKTTQLSMLRFIIPIVGERFPNALDNQTAQLIHRGFEFTTPEKMSYHCTRAQKFNLTETVIDLTVAGIVRLSDVQVEAFRTASNSTSFSTARDCDSSDTPDIVPIAVGIALVALILIVLIAYLFARRRSTSRGYMSF